jgi:succinyl-diaminopimelate desuccinylase
VIGRVAAWLADHGVPAVVLTDEHGATVGLTSEVRGARPGSRWVLDACLDTAPFGDERAWTFAPTSALIKDGWLWGRGSADSKSDAAIFCHIAVRLAAMASQMHGSLVLLFDVDEHTGGFGGAQALLRRPWLTPGCGRSHDRVPRHGQARHRRTRRASRQAAGTRSGLAFGRPHGTPSAIKKAAHLIRVLSASDLPDGTSAEFRLPRKLTVTAIEGGQGYSVTPDLCTLNVDIRTTLAFDGQAAPRLLEDRTAEVDDAWPGTRPTVIQADTRWPAYALAEDSPLRAAVLGAAQAAGVTVEAKIAGPSNIGNYLAGLGIPATAGFGVSYTGLHGTNERIRQPRDPARTRAPLGLADHRHHPPARTRQNLTTDNDMPATRPADNREDQAPAHEQCVAELFRSLDQAAPLRGAGSGAPRAGLCAGGARPARPRRPAEQYPLI